jgi:hypothetical protein
MAATDEHITHRQAGGGRRRGLAVGARRHGRQGQRQQQRKGGSGSDQRIQRQALLLLTPLELILNLRPTRIDRRTLRRTPAAAKSFA